MALFHHFTITTAALRRLKRAWVAHRVFCAEMRLLRAQLAVMKLKAKPRRMPQ